MQTDSEKICSNVKLANQVAKVLGDSHKVVVQLRKEALELLRRLLPDLNGF